LEGKGWEGETKTRIVFGRVGREESGEEKSHKYGSPSPRRIKWEKNRQGGENGIVEALLP